MSSSDSYYIEILNRIVIYLFRYVTPVFYVVGMIGNVLSVLVFMRKSWKKNVCVFYFKFFFFINVVSLNATMLGSIFVRGFDINLQNSSIVLCKIFYYVPYVSAFLSPTILILASIDRLLISSQNFDTRLYSSKRLAYFSVSISTIFWLVFYIHILIKVNLQQFGLSTYICYYDFSKIYINFVDYSSAIINVILCFLMIILCLFAFKNVRHIKILPRQQRNQLRSMKKKDFQLLRCLFVQDIIYIIFSTSLSISSTYNAIADDFIRTSLQETIANFIYSICNICYSTIYFSSFFVFIIVSKAFRHELKRFIYKIFGRELIALREEDQRHENIPRDNIELNVVSNNIVL